MIKRSLHHSFISLQPTSPTQITHHLSSYSYTRLLSSYSDVKSLNSTIRCFTDAADHKRAIQFYHEIRSKGFEPDKFTFTFVLKACVGTRDSKNGALVHAQVAVRGLHKDIFISTGLVDMYSKMGSVDIARQVFDAMPARDAVSWNAMIAGFSQNGYPREALSFFRKMQSFGVEPHSVTFLNLFPGVCEMSSLVLCRSLHGCVVKRGFLRVVFNGLIDTYSKCGDVEAARRVFDGMLGDNDDVTWATMISGFAKNGCFSEALEVFDDLRRRDSKLNQVSVVSALSAASEIGDLESGVNVHYYAIKKGLDFDVQTSTMLMTMYAKCGVIAKAKWIFDEIHKKDTVAWSAMISALTQTGYPKDALSLFREMLMAGFLPNKITIVSVLPACGDTFDASSLRGKSIHCYALRSGIDSDVSVGTALISMYAHCRVFTSAHAVFDRLQHKEVVTWNTLINGYAQIGDANSALKMFQELQSTRLQPDSGTMVGVLPACALLNASNLGSSFHGLVIKKGFDSDLHVKNATIDMYAKCAKLHSAEVLFFETKCYEDVISWNTMIAGYVQNGNAKDAVSVFRQMQTENLKPNLVTLVSVIPAVAQLSSLRDGLALQSFVIRTGFESHVLIGNSLIDMYSKCGQIDYAEDFFNSMKYRVTVSWNVMLTGYATHGLSESCIGLYREMRDNGIKADSLSFLGILSACRHSGLVEEGKEIFKSMSSQHELEPCIEHFACMVDLLGRAGRLDEAWDLIQRMPMAPDAGVWGALLGSCGMYSNVTIGELAAANLMKLEPENPAHHVSLSNIYAQVGQWADARKMRDAMRDVGMKKTPGWSWA